MLFNSSIFLCAFLPLAIVLYYILPGKMKNTVLLIASLVFYAWGDLLYLPVLCLSMFFHYIVATRLEKIKNKRRRRTHKIGIIGIDLLLMGGFLIGKGSVPLGMGFYTLQQIAYILDVAEGRTEAEKSLSDYALFIAFFPRMLIGPLLDHHTHAKQIRVREVSFSNIGIGMRRFVVGLAKKMILAEAAMEITRVVFGAEQISVLSAWIGCFAFSFQIYIELSGYSDMAIGLGRVFGFEFPENFQYPFLAKSVYEYWGRFLSTWTDWFKRYIYAPLGKGVIALFVTWGCMGIWNGIQLHYFVWGEVLFFVILLQSYLFKRVWKKIPDMLRILLTQLIMMLSWVLFFSPSLGKAIEYYKTMFGLRSARIVDHQAFFLLKSHAVLFLVFLVAATPICKTLLQSLAKEKTKIIGYVSLASLILLGVLTIGHVKGVEKIAAKDLVNGSYMKQVEVRFQEAVPGKKLVQEGKNLLHILSGNPYDQGIYRGKDSYLFEEIATMDEEQMQEKIKWINRFKGKNKETEMFLMLVPNSANILKDKLPAFAPVEDQKKQLSFIKKELNASVSWIDLSTTLNAHKTEDIYYHTERYWTTLGAYYGYEVAKEALGIKEPMIEMEKLGISNRFNGSLSKKSGLKEGYKEVIYGWFPKKMQDLIVEYEKEGLTTTSLYSMKGLRSRDSYRVFLNGDHAKIQIRTTNVEKKNLLVVKNGFANCFVPFLTAHYNKIVLIDPEYYRGDLTQVIKEEEIDQVLFLYDVNTFCKDERLQEVLMENKDKDYGK